MRPISRTIRANGSFSIRRSDRNIFLEDFNLCAIRPNRVTIQINFETNKRLLKMIHGAAYSSYNSISLRERTSTSARYAPNLRLRAVFPLRAICYKRRSLAAVDYRHQKYSKRRTMCSVALRISFYRICCMEFLTSDCSRSDPVNRF